MAVETVAPRSRRALLGTALGGAAAFVASALGRPSTAVAGAPYGNGDTLVIGRNHTNAATLTYINNPNNAGYVFGAQSTAGGVALSGVSNTNNGVEGVSGSNYGSGKAGVYAEGLSGRGVHGKTNTGVGTYGAAHGNGSGVLGEAKHQDAVAVAAVNIYQNGPGYALLVQGRMFFSRGSMSTIPVGSRTVTATLGVQITANTQILATLDTNQAGLFLHSVTKNTTNSNFKITLSAKVASGKYAKVSYLLIN